MSKPLAVLALSLAAIVSTADARAQSYPSRNLTLVIPYSAGGGTDLMGRLYADKLSTRLKQPVVVENRVGAGSTIGTAYVARSAPNGYTLLFNGSSLTFHPGLFRTLTYDLKKDLRPVAVLAGQPFVMYASLDFPPRTIPELVALATAEPGRIPYASVGVGSAGHLASELLWSRLGIRLLHIPYRGTPQAMNDLLPGEVKMLYTTISGGADLLRAGKVKALGISSLQRSAALPEVPTIAEQGLAGYEFASWLAVFVPTATPDDLVQRLAAVTAEIVDDPEVRAQFESQGLDVQSTTPETAK